MDPDANVNTESYTFDGPQPFTFEPVSCSRDWEQMGVGGEITKLGQKSSCGVRTWSELDSFLASD